MYNKGVMTAEGVEKDNGITPEYAVYPLIPYIKDMGYKSILCPFDTKESSYVKVLSSAGFKVVHMHISEGYDFFDIDTVFEDIIISNPPYSKKDEVLKHLYELNKPFAMLLPLTTLQSTKRTPMFRYNGLELMVFDRRICFYDADNPSQYLKGIAFATGYFCKGLIPTNLTFEILKEEL